MTSPEKVRHLGEYVIGRGYVTGGGGTSPGEVRNLGEDTSPGAFPILHMYMDVYMSIGVCVYVYMCISAYVYRCMRIG